MADGESLDVFSRKWLLVVILCCLPLFLLFAVLGDPGGGRAAMIAAGVNMTAMRACWNLRKHRWFWMLAGLVIALHIFLVLSIPWSSKSYPGYALLPVAIVDYGVVYGGFKLAEKILKRTDQASAPN
jgi:multisubunit Na+/H+ antiporter MnhB subunit